MAKERSSENPQEIQPPIGENRPVEFNTILPNNKTQVVKGFTFGSTFISPEMSNHTPPKEAIEAVEKRLS